MMSRKKKIFIILNLCLAFTFFCWLFIQPFVKEVLIKKTEGALYETAIEKEAYFQEISPEVMQDLQTGHQKLQHKKFSHAPAFSEMHVFALTWLFFSLTLSILLLLHIQGAAPALWILPAIVLAYGYALYQTPSPLEETLFPTEAYVAQNYIQEEDQHLKQRDQLLKGWHRFLVTEWAKEPPSTDQETYSEQLEKGLFRFNLARLQWVHEGKGHEVLISGLTAPPSLLRLLGYFIWNLGFAWLINRKEKSLGAQSSPSFSG